MPRLYLLRHGTAVPHGTAGVREEDRPLTREGEEGVARVAAGLKRLKVAPARVYTSPLPRARRTAEIAAGVLGLPDRVENADVLQPGSPPRVIRDWVASKGDGGVMLVGHNPNLTDLLCLLVGLPEGAPGFALKKGGVAALERDARGRCTLKWLATPRMIRRLLD